jgi:tetratricopeptide (TPR) repeat protein
MLAMVASTTAVRADDWDDCRTDSPDKVMAGCTAVIEQHARKDEDLDQANVESYYVRASVYQAQGKSDRAIADLRKAVEFAPTNPFEILAQANARKRIDQLTKNIPCSMPGEGGSCL